MSASGFPSLNQLNVITESDLEAVIHEGNGYALTIEIVVPDNQTQYYVLKTPPNKVVKVKGRTINTGGGLRYTPYVDGTWTLGSVVPVIRNLNGLVPKTNLTKLYAVTDVVNEGTAIDVVRTPTSQGSSGNPVTYAPDGAERILSMDREYLLEFDNIDNNEIWCVYSLIITEEDVTIIDAPDPDTIF